MNGLSQICNDFSVSGFPVELKEIDNRIRKLIDTEMGYIATLHDPAEIIAREAAFQDLLNRLEEARKKYIDAHPETNTDEKETQEHFRLARLINPAPYLTPEGKNIQMKSISRKYFGSPIPTDDGISRLAVRLLLLPLTWDHPRVDYEPTVKIFTYRNCAAFRPDAQWPNWIVGTPFEAFVILENNLSVPNTKTINAFAWLCNNLSHTEFYVFPTKVAELHNNAVLGLLEQAKQLAESNQIIALGKLLHDSCISLRNAKIIKKDVIEYDPELIKSSIINQFKECLSKVDITNEYALVDALTACHFSRSSFLYLLGESDLQILEKLDFSLISEEHLEALDSLGHYESQLNTDSQASTESDLANFWVNTWTKKRIKEASEVPPDLKLLLPNGETLQVHGALLAQKSEGLLSLLRDPKHIDWDIPIIDLSSYKPSAVSFILRKVYNIKCGHNPSKSLDQLKCYLYGSDPEPLHGKYTPPQGRDVLTDLNIICMNHTVLYAHRIILSKVLGLPIGKELDWSKVQSEDAQYLLNYLYSRELDQETIHLVIESARELDLHQVLNQIQNTFESEVSKISKDIEDFNEFGGNLYLKRPMAIMACDFLRAICASAPSFFSQFFDPLELLLDKNKPEWMSDLSNYSMKSYQFDRCITVKDIEKIKKRIRNLSPSFVFGNLLLAEVLEDDLQIERWNTLAKSMFKECNSLEIPVIARPKTISFRGMHFDCIEWIHLCKNIVCNPGMEVDLSETNISDHNLQWLLQNSYPILSLKLDGCKLLSPAVQKLLGNEVPSSEELEENSQLIQYLANSKGMSSKREDAEVDN
jgi:hypothetical protein